MPTSRSGLRSWIGRAGAGLIKVWLWLFGRTVRRADEPWLIGPIGPDGEIGEAPYAAVAAREGLTLDTGAAAGLVSDFDALAGPGFAVARVDREVRRFYEETSAYELDVWTESPLPGRIFLWLIVTTVSRYMNQLNFPLSGLETSRGMSSQVLSLRAPDGRVVYTGWLRKLAEQGRVVYTGFYSTEQPPGHDARCVKVVFPLPHGNATVILRPGLQPDGRFELVSSGKRFGDPGFYRVLELDEERLRVLHMRTLREHFEVYTDEAGALRCDHRVTFLGLTMLRLHYRMRRRAGA